MKALNVIIKLKLNKLMTNYVIYYKTLMISYTKFETVLCESYVVEYTQQLREYVQRFNCNTKICAFAVHSNQKADNIN